jgi:SagB-type dehydrogenase family enzyme
MGKQRFSRLSRLWSAPGHQVPVDPSPESTEPLWYGGLGPPRRRHRALLIYTHRHAVRIAGSPNLVRRILAQCYGALDQNAIIERSGRFRRSRVAGALAELRAAGVVLRASELPEFLHYGTDNVDPAWEATGKAHTHGPSHPGPPRMCRSEGTFRARVERSTFADLCACRRSAVLGPGSRSIPLPDISALVALAYARNAEDQRSVPSAGGLWPLVNVVIAREDGRRNTRSAWVFDAEASVFRFHSDLLLDGLRAWFVEDAGLDAALLAGAGLVVICADWGRTGDRYAARGYRYGLIEAGALSQTLALAAAERGLGCRLIGGYYDHRVAHDLRLRARLLPVVVLAITGSGGEA